MDCLAIRHEAGEASVSDRPLETVMEDAPERADRDDTDLQALDGKRLDAVEVEQRRGRGRCESSTPIGSASSRLTA